MQYFISLYFSTHMFYQLFEQDSASYDMKHSKKITNQ